MDHYSILGVSREASLEEIKKAYRKLAMQHHPDQGGDISKFHKLNEAYETLSDPSKKHLYDNPRKQSQHPGGFNFNVNGFDLNDIFRQAFGQQGPNPFDNNPFRQTQQQLYRTRLEISLMDSYYGEEKALQVSSPTGVSAIKVKVPPGTKSGDQVRYDGVIDGAHLVIEFIVLPDLKFDRRGNDLYFNLPISILDLIVGTKVDFRTIDGKMLSVNIPPRTQPTMQIKISGEGMPISDSGHYGDQILLLKPILPDNIDDDIIEAIINSRNK